MSERIEFIIQWIGSTNIFLKAGCGLMLLMLIVTVFLRTPWGHWRFGNKYKKFNDRGQEVEHDDEYWRNYYKKKIK